MEDTIQEAAQGAAGTINDAIANTLGEEAAEVSMSALRKIWALMGTPPVLALLTVLFWLLLAKAVLIIADRTVSKMKVEETAKRFTHSAFRIVVYVVALLGVAGNLGFDISSLVAAFSVCGAAVALAAQEILGDFFGGVQMMFTKPFVVGNYIVTPEGEGTVIEVGLINTRIRTLDNKIIIIPNRKLATDTVSNSSSLGTRRIDLRFSVSYDSDIDLVQETMRHVLNENPMVLHTPEVVADPITPMVAHGESALVFLAQFWCHSTDYWPVQYALIEDMKRAFDKAGIEIPYNHLNVHVIPNP